MDGKISMFGKKMKPGRENRPDNWPASVQILIALCCALPPVVLLAAGENMWTIVAAGVGIGIWCCLGRGTRGFPFLFDLLAFKVLLISLISAVVAAIRLFKSA